MRFRAFVITGSATLIAAASTGLSGYVGKYPFEKVQGVSFLANAQVRQQVARHTPLALQKTILSPNIVGSPIARISPSLITATMCEPHNCGPHNWSILISADGAQAAVCHVNWEEEQTGAWFHNRIRFADQPDGLCPGTLEGIPRVVQDRLSAPRVADRPVQSTSSNFTPAPGSAERQAMLAPIRTFVQGELGSPVEFVVKTLNVSGQYGFASLQPMRPGGVRLDPDTTPAAVKFRMKNGNLDNFYCCETTAILQRRAGGGWSLLDIRIGATDAWYHAYRNRVPQGLFTPR
jgi:hypothetical protein